MTTFSERVVKLALSIPAGRVTTYGRIARAAGRGGQSARSVSGILGRAYGSGIDGIPFHRIVYSNGRIWIDDAYINERMKLYKKEGIEINRKGNIIDFNKILFKFN
jgi:methylated-DNA-protein-cysteine methyltransferase-like protein